MVRTPDSTEGWAIFQWGDETPHWSPGQVPVVCKFCNHLFPAPINILKSKRVQFGKGGGLGTRCLNTDCNKINEVRFAVGDHGDLWVPEEQAQRLAEFLQPGTLEEIAEQARRANKSPYNEMANAVDEAVGKRGFFYELAQTHDLKKRFRKYGAKGIEHFFYAAMATTGVAVVNYFLNEGQPTSQETHYHYHEHQPESPERTEPPGEEELPPTQSV